MSTYVVGDVQGCFDELEALLCVFSFNPPADRLVLAGDLINRGPKSLETLRKVRSLGESAVTVLGNHDLHLLAAANGSRPPKPKDTLAEILQAPDCDELIAWLSEQHVAYFVDELQMLVVHAGIPPQWTITEALARAGELEAALRSPRRGEFLTQMYGNEPSLWDARLSGMDRLRYITNAFTRIRYIDGGGALDMKQAGPPGSQPDGLTPWYEVPDRASEGTKIAFGHWATLQTEAPLDPRHGVFHLDTGCVWGGRLSAIRLEDERVFSVPSAQPKLTRD